MGVCLRVLAALDRHEKKEKGLKCLARIMGFDRMDLRLFRQNAA